MTRRPSTARARPPLWVTGVLVAALAAPGPAVAAGPVVAQSAPSSGVGELWKEYPLKDATATPEATPGAAARPQASRATPVPSVAPRRTPAAPPEDGGGNGGSVLVIVGGLAGLAGVAALLAGLRSAAPPGRAAHQSRPPLAGSTPRRAADPAEPVYVEGLTDREGIGAFAGRVEYEQAAGAGPDDARMLLVDDPARDAPVWVMRSEVLARHAGESSAPDRAEPARARRFAPAPPGAERRRGARAPTRTAR